MMKKQKMQAEADDEDDKSKQGFCYSTRMWTDFRVRVSGQR